MFNFMLFWTNGEYTRDDRNLTPCGLEDHLGDLRKWDTTPDFWDASDDLKKMVVAATLDGRPLTLVDSSKGYTVVTVFNTPQEEPANA